MARAMHGLVLEPGLTVKYFVYESRKEAMRVQAKHSERKIPARVEALARQGEEERFAWFATQVRPIRGRYTPERLAEFFEGVPTWPGQREKALVLLALDGSSEALNVLESLDLGRHGQALQMLHTIALERVTLTRP